MSQSAILEKLRRALQEEVITEGQVVYILVEIRKAIEQAGEQSEYYALDFYCSWALHTKMDKAGAVRILKRFDEAYPLLVQNVPFEELPHELQDEIHQTIGLRKFRDQMRQFLRSNDLPIRIISGDAWSKFARLYGLVIDECSLVLKEGKTGLKFLDRIDRKSVV